MKSIRNLKLVMKVGFMALALCLAASQGKAQGTYMAKFILPFEARGESAVLPPGGHTIVMDLDSIRLINPEKSFRISTAGHNIGVALRLAEIDMKTNGLRDNRGAGLFETKHVISPYSVARNEGAKWRESRPDKQGFWRFNVPMARSLNDSAYSSTPYFMTMTWGKASFSRSRYLAKRDITVPTGTPDTSAISFYDNPSISGGNNASRNSLQRQVSSPIQTIEDKTPMPAILFPEPN
jgi:hypothetical protein